MVSSSRMNIDWLYSIARRVRLTFLPIWAIPSTPMHWIQAANQRTPTAHYLFLQPCGQGSGGLNCMLTWRIPGNSTKSSFSGHLRPSTNPILKQRKFSRHHLAAHALHGCWCPLEFLLHCHGFREFLDIVQSHLHTFRLRGKRLNLGKNLGFRNKPWVSPMAIYISVPMHQNLHILIAVTSSYTNIPIYASCIRQMISHLYCSTGHYQLSFCDPTKASPFFSKNLLSDNPFGWHRWHLSRSPCVSSV